MDCSLFQTLGQVSSDEVGQVFRDHLRGCIRQMVAEVMAAEVSELCGPKHHPVESDHFRAGSSSGRVLFEGEREEVVRPRVRKQNGDGSSEEVVLATYQAAGDPTQLQASIVN
ncbi:MAG: putative transposase, partial [Mariniblastus sp.]